MLYIPLASKTGYDLYVPETFQNMIIDGTNAGTPICCKIFSTK